jgi:UDP-N-acetylmuramoyl-tripeptide--D-alanyl-D-alanine ligase
MKVKIDSRDLEPGDIFIPVRGPRFDGRDFIKEALAKGARVLDVDLTKYAKAYRKKLTCKVIGITGSAGKTTVKDLVASVLSQKYKVVKTKENLNNEFGVPLTILQADFDTEILIVEMAMRHKGEIGHLTQIVRPTHAIITSIGMTHIENLGSQKNIAKAKGEIFKKPLQTETSPRYAFLNFSSPFYTYLKDKAESCNYSVLPFEGQDKPDQNINLCYQVGRHFGLSRDEVNVGLASYNPSSHRLNVIKKNNITLIDDCYNANPDGVLFSLQYLRRFSGRKILVLGDMLELGDFSKEAHQAVYNQAVENGISILFTVGQHSRVLQDLSTDALPVYSFLDKKAMHHHLIPELKAGDVILVKGSRGMKLEETVEALHHVL